MTGADLLAALLGLCVLTSRCPALQISTGLDSSNTFQIVRCIRDFVHLRQATVLMALLQPAPETYELFDDVLLLSEGGLVVLLPVESGHVFGYVVLCCGRLGTADFHQPLSGLGWCASASVWGQILHWSCSLPVLERPPIRLGKSSEKQCSRQLPPTQATSAMT